MVGELFMYINHEEVCRLLEDGKNATRDDVLKILNKAREKNWNFS